MNAYAYIWQPNQRFPTLVWGVGIVKPILASRLERLG